MMVCIHQQYIQRMGGINEELVDKDMYTHLSDKFTANLGTEVERKLAEEKQKEPAAVEDAVIQSRRRSFAIEFQFRPGWKA